MKTFQKNIISIYGSLGRQWLESLHDVMLKIARSYYLVNLTPVRNMIFNYVASRYQNGNPTILKIGLKTKKLVQEVFWLKAFKKYVAAEAIADADGMVIIWSASDE